LANALSDSLRHGNGTGIGSSGGGLGLAKAAAQVAAFRTGVNGVSVPVCLYCRSQYSDEARKGTKGTVVL
jgi:hypothetical protein